jgi:hypothetical protein|tara:strand:+ start:1686 stop:2426 length:741 start_codon:yes stop_codon:yes gene_type:complete
MLKEPIKELQGKKIAIVAMGRSQIDFHLSQIHSVKFDEVWAINAMIGVIPNINRAFILDPMSRFFDTYDAGDMTDMMQKVLPKVTYPIYTCQVDKRVPATEEFPLSTLINDLSCSYFNNTIAYSIAFGLWNKVKSINIFGVDFTYKNNMHFAEAGRACCEFWISKCLDNKINVSIAPNSNLLDTNVPLKDKLYGYHRLKDPKISYQNDLGLQVCKWSEIVQEENKPIGMIGRDDLQFNNVPEPNKY